MANQLDFRVKNGLFVGGGANITGAITSVDSIQLDTAATYAAPGNGKIVWNETDSALEVGLGNDVIASLPETTLYHVTNNTGSTIAKGTLVASVGTVGNSGKILIAPYLASSHTPIQIMGITAESIANGATGHVAHFAKVRGIQTNGGNYGEVWVDGDILYARSTGGLTKTKPVAPNTKTSVAIVISSHVSNGILFVRPTISSGLADNDLVQLTSIANGDLLVYNSTTARFENTTRQSTLNGLAAATTTGFYLRGNGTNLVMSAIQAGDVPTLNQSTSGTAAIATTVTLAATNTTNAAHYLTFVDTATGNANVRTDTDLTYNPSTNTLSVGSASITSASVIQVTDNVNAALRITQLGTGNALIVEDEANPDATPFVIANNGTVIVGNTSRITQVNLAEVHGSATINSSPAIGVYSWGTLATGGGLNLYKSRSGTVGTYSTAANGSQSSVRFQFDDGAAFQQAASIIGSVEGTPAINSTPGRLTFATTPDASVTPLERMRIDSTGQTKFSYNTVVEVTDNANAALRITQLGTSNALVVEDSTNPDATPFVIDANGKVAIGATTATENLNLVSDGRNFLQLTRASTDANQSVVSFRKARGTNSVPTIVVTNDVVGDTQFYGYDGAGYVQVASFFGAVDGTPGVNDMPGRLVFSTTADGASTPTERVRINNAGLVGINQTNPQARLQVEELGIDTTTTTLAVSTGITAVYSVTATLFRTMELMVQITQGSNYHSAKLFAIHNGTDVWFNQTNVIHTTAAELGTFSMDISSGSVRLLYTPTSTATASTVKVAAMKIAV